MEEYSCACSCPGAVVGDRERVFCRIYVSLNAGADSAARKESAAFSEQPVTPLNEPVAIAHAQGPIMKPPCPKRIRGAPISPIRPPPAAVYARPCVPQSDTAPPSESVTPTLPAPPRPYAASELQQARTYHVPEPAAARHLPPRAPPAQQAPLTPSLHRPLAFRTLFASPDPILFTETEDAAEDEGCFGEFKNELDKMLTEEAEEEEESAACPEDTPSTTEPAVVKQEADDDMDQFAGFLGDMLDAVEEIQVSKKMDPFAAAFADEAEFRM